MKRNLSLPILLYVLVATAAIACLGQSLIIKGQLTVGRVQESTGPVQGQIVGVQIASNGWQAIVTVYDMATNGTFNFGIPSTSTSNVFITTNFLLNVTSMGYDSACNPTTMVRRVFGTKHVRRAYPNQTNELTVPIVNSTTNAGYITLLVALSDYVYSRDSNVTATVAAGWYYDSARTNTALSSLAVTNYSAQPYAKVIANWSDVPCQIVSNDYKLRVVTFHRHATAKKPVAAVKFWGHQGTTTNAFAVATEMTTNAIHGDLNPVCEYIGTLNDGVMASKSMITNHYVAYPWVGDESTVATSTNKAWRDPYGGPFFTLCNRSNDYGFAYAVVDPTNAIGATGIVTSNMTFGTAFSNISLAMNAILSSNNTWYGRSNWGGGNIFLTNGSYRWCVPQPTACAFNNEWLTITPLSGVNSNDVYIITNSLGAIQTPYRVKVQEVTFTQPTNNSSFNYGHIWLDRCYVRTNTTARNFFYFVTNFWVTGCTFEQQASGLVYLNSAVTDRGFIRGSYFTGPTLLRTWVTLSSVFTAQTNSTVGVQNDILGGDSGIDPMIFAYNRLYRGNNSYINIGQYRDIEVGAAIVQNLLEQTESTAGTPWITIGDTEHETPDAVTNTLVWYNTVVGQRYLQHYNETADYIKYTAISQSACNVADEYATKHDNWGTPSSARTNRWSCLFSVGYRGNAYAGVYGSGSTHPENVNNWGFAGPSVWTSTGTNPWPQWAFSNAQCQMFGLPPDGAGEGNYTPMPGSVLNGLDSDPLLPYDLGGVPRYIGGSAGSYTIPE